MFKVLFITSEGAAPNPLPALAGTGESDGFELSEYRNPVAALGQLYENPPDIIILDLREADDRYLNLANQIKNDFYFNLIPLVGLFSKAVLQETSWEQAPLDDFIRLERAPEELFQRMNLALVRTRRVLDNNPLSRLPGNTSIQRALEAGIGKNLIIGYVDINDFKPFNDRFGFSAGDEVILIMARLLANRVRDRGRDCFVGHIGGDDFVFIIPLELGIPVSEEIIEHFDDIMKNFFTEGVSETGTYGAVDREGRERELPLPGIAIALVPLNIPDVKHVGQVVAFATEMKKTAKNLSGSGWALFNSDSPTIAQTSAR